METINKKEKLVILEKAKDWWRKELAPAHKSNTLKLGSLDEFDINPFAWSYLAYFLEGNDKPESIAKALIYPRALGTSFTTIFGTRFQSFIARVFEGVVGSTVPGIDLEFIDKLDGRRKYCQIKAGPNVVNRDDVTSVKSHFNRARMQARTNQLPVQVDDYLFCLIYGEPAQKNGFVKEIEKEYTVIIGKEFWHRFTGDPDFYADLIQSIGEVASEVNMKRTVKKVIKELALNIEKELAKLKN